MPATTLQELREKYELARRHRRPFERDWALNSAFIAGEQYVAWADYDPNSRLVEIENPTNSVRALNNICIQIARTETAKILKNNPVPTALPVTDSQDDQYAARIVDAYFKYLQDEWNFDRKLRTGVYYLVSTGNVFFKWFWAGSDTQMAVVSPFDVYPDPYARTMQDCRWMIHSQFLDVDAALEVYKGVRSANKDALRTSETQSLTSVENRVFSNYGVGDKNLPGVTLYEYWEPPNPTHPKGQFISYTDAGIVYKSDFPYAHGRMPFTHAGHVNRVSSKWHASVMDFVRPIQEELNRTESQIIENRNISNGIFFIPTEVKLSQPITGEPRQEIGWEGPLNQNPQNWFVQPQGMAQWVGGEPDRLKGTAFDVVAQHEVSRGGTVGRVESGQAIQLLQETDDSVMKGTIHSLEESISDGFAMTAQLFRQYGEPEKLVRAYDKDGMVEVVKLKRDLIPLNMRVRVQTTTGLPQTVAGKWDRVLNLLQYQVITPDRAIELLDLSTEDPELTPDAQDRKNQYRENNKMLQGELQVPDKWDNHDVHIEELNKCRKTEEYRRAVAGDPFIKQRFQFHEDEHKKLRDMVDQEMAARQAAMAAAAAPPAPPGDGGGAAPPGPPGGGAPAPPEPTTQGPAPVGS
jgi:hypothetical protein